MRRKTFVTAAVCLAVFIGIIFAKSEEGIGAAKQTLTAAAVKTAPSGLDDAAWEKAPAIEVPFEGKEVFAGKKTAVKTQAVYTDDSVYFLFKWRDPTLSVTKGAWIYDGQAWTHQKGNEDRISLLFEIDRINNFATRGCAIVCHVPQGAPSAKEGRFGTSSAAEKGDLWHWKAARSDPAGFADDTWLTAVSEKKGGRKNDAGNGGDSSNETEDKSLPKYMPAPGTALGKHGVLLAAHASEISDYAMFKSGDTLTHRMPKTPEGSRADIKAVSQYADGAWTVMLHRRLDTGNEDDVAFNPRRKYNFAMALFDDSGDENSYDSEVITLEFGR
jgi:hypothetical protein